MSGMLEVTVSVPCQAWRDAIADVEGVCKSAVEATCSSKPPCSMAEVSIVLADDAFIQKLNRDYRGKDEPTNVLSFTGDHGLPEVPGAEMMLGDVVVSYETITAEAKENGRDIKDHLSHLIVHGMLHLLGFDHRDDEEASKMEEMEVSVLTGIGINNPYK